MQSPSSLHLTPAMRQALQENQGQPVYLQDEETGKMYLLVEQQVDEGYIREGLQVALDQVESGQVEDWDIESILHDGRRLCEQRNNQR